MAGRVAVRSQRAAAVEVSHDGFVLRDVPGRRSRSGRVMAYGFMVNLAGVPREFRLQLRARLADGTLVDLGTVRGRRQPLRPSSSTTFRPLFIRCMGRMGTTWLMRLLAEHPALLVHRRYPYETGAARYWIHVFRVLTSAPAYVQPPTSDVLRPISAPARVQPATTEALRPTEWRELVVEAAELSSADPSVAGPNPLFGEYLDDAMTGLGGQGSISPFAGPAPLPARAPWGTLVAWLGDDYARHVGRFCQQSIDGFYQQVAGLQGEQGEVGGRYVVEKNFDTWDGADLNWELYPDAREIVLVRDLRDVLCSVFAVNAGIDRPRFGRAFFASDTEYIHELAARAARLLRSWQDRSDRVHLVRYEDLVAAPIDSLTKLLRYLDLDARPEVAAAMVRSARAETPELAGHRTSRDTASSVERWRRELAAELQMVCEETMGDTLEAFGYPRR